ncbi:hypothetical protein FPQ18DRAFT_303784 [Pyronema domesticum]|nr:hypothetical protein FPQ18DRAFT_303784 [Pyronema domesticum]
MAQKNTSCQPTKKSRIDMADKFPMAEVIGTDLSPKQSSRVPSNWFVPVKFVLTAIRLIDAICSRFEVDDAMLEWTFQEVRIRPQHRGFKLGTPCFRYDAVSTDRCTALKGYVELCENGIAFDRLPKELIIQNHWFITSPVCLDGRCTLATLAW